LKVIGFFLSLFVSTSCFAATAENPQEQQARGKALADQGGCAACHSPPGGPAYSGNVIGGWEAFNITSDPVAGIGDWSQEELEQYLRTGHVNGKAQAAGPMADIITNITGILSKKDLAALATYLHSIPPANPKNETKSRSSWGDPATDVESIRGLPFQEGDLASGARLYVGNCATCHGASGVGSPGGHYPSLINNSATGAPTPYNLVNVIINGVSRKLKSGEEYFMPGFADELSDGQIVSLAEYVLRRFGQGGVEVTLKDVADRRQ